MCLQKSNQQVLTGKFLASQNPLHAQTLKANTLATLRVHTASELLYVCVCVWVEGVEGISAVTCVTAFSVGVYILKMQKKSADGVGH